MTTTEIDCLSSEAAASALAGLIAERIRRSVDEKGKAVIAVSGGRTPKLVFPRLLSCRINWSSVTVTLTDERWVANDHADSNERLVREHLLRGPAKSAKFVPLYCGESTPEEGLQSCESRLLSAVESIDAVYLGMGTDGHIASLFPHTSVINSKKSTCVAVSATGNRLARLSLSLDTILSAREVFLLYFGQEKDRVFKAIKSSDDLPDHPLWSILSQKETPVCVLRSI